MAEDQNPIERPPPFGEVPAEYIDPEGGGELQDPALALESTADMRRAWSDWLCAKGPGEFANVKFFGKGIGGVPAPAVDAYIALEAALQASGYRPHGAWSNKCRKIAHTDRYSLHAYGVAIDIDAGENPQSPGDPYSGRIQKAHVDAVLSIRNTDGRRVWLWGGAWTTPDRMHFQLDQGPNDVVIDPATVPGAVHVELEGVTHVVTATSLNMRSEPATSGALIAGLPSGSKVAAQSDAVQEADGHRWFRVEAVVGGQLLAGWVASEYLEASDAPAGMASTADSNPKPAAAAPEAAMHTEGATHRVRATSLNLRAEPTTSGSLLASLPNGTEVVTLPDPTRESDDYRWVKVSAPVDGKMTQGWVAEQYLDAVS
jgi:uncharacterized protein YraI